MPSSCHLTPPLSPLYSAAAQFPMRNPMSDLTIGGATISTSAPAIWPLSFLLLPTTHLRQLSCQIMPF